jgi:uncharacterized protein DUF4258
VGDPNLDSIRAAFCAGTYLLTPTAVAKVLWKRGLKAEHLKTAVCDDAPEIIERYPDDPRGPACLVLGWVPINPPLHAAQPLHIVIGYACIAGTEIEVITAYEPDSRHWQTPKVRRP